MSESNRPVLRISTDSDTKCQVEEGCRNSLALWGLDYFDLYLVHFPVSIEYIDPKVKFPQEWWGLDGKVHPSKFRPFVKYRVVL